MPLKKLNNQKRKYTILINFSIFRTQENKSSLIERNQPLVKLYQQSKYVSKSRRKKQGIKTFSSIISQKQTGGSFYGEKIQEKGIIIYPHPCQRIKVKRGGDSEALKVWVLAVIGPEVL